MDRRHLLLAGAAALFAPGAARAEAMRTDAYILYVSARDCPFCLEWNAYDRPAFERLCKEARVVLREVQVMRFSDIREEAAWPPDLKPVLKQIVQSEGTPRFIVVHRGKIIQHAVGRRQFQLGILPMFV